MFDSWENSQTGFHIHGLRVIMAGRARYSPLKLSLSTKIINQEQSHIQNYRD